MAIPDKYKGKSFAEIANNLQSKYKDRHDPISLRGLNKDMGDLQEAQDYKKQLMAIQQQTEQLLNNPQGMQPQGQVQEQAPNMEGMPAMGGNENAQVNIPQEQTTFNREASSDYNEKFWDGGFSDTSDVKRIETSAGISGGIVMPNVDVTGVDVPSSDSSSRPDWMGGVGLAMQTAPLIGNIASLATLQKPEMQTARTINTNGITAALKNFNPRENRFDKVDLNQVERGINEASGRFTQNNVNASRGNAGSFIANEMGNQLNLYRGIGDARLKAQLQDQNTAQLNAADRARVDNMNFQKASSIAQLEGTGDMFNAKMQYATDTTNAQNNAAYESEKAKLWSNLASNVANIGSSLSNVNTAANTQGYGQSGGYGNMFANGGEMNTDGLEMTTGIKAPQKVPVENKTGTMLDYIDSEVKFPSEQQELIDHTQDILNTYMQSRDVLSKYGEPTKYVDDKIKYRKKSLDKMLKDKEKYLLDNSLKSIMLAKKKK
jgi:hypothetical protein